MDFYLLPPVYVITVAVVLGALVGSFTNVLIYRIPRKESVAFPPSHCPNCDHQLGPLDLVPVFSWLFLRGRCRYCKAPISAQYPIIETISAVGYGLLAWAFPFEMVGAGLLGLFVFFTVLLTISMIDLKTREIPDELSLGGLLLGLGLAWMHTRQGGVVMGLPGLEGAVAGALAGAGTLALVGNLGAYVLRRFREEKHPSSPIDYQHLNLGALVGLWAGPYWAAGVVVLALLLNLATRRYLRIPDFITWPGIVLSLVLAIALGVGPGLLEMLKGLIGGAGIAALIAGFYWWLVPFPEEDNIPEEDQDPIAMGFGDVKLLAMIGAFVGVSNVFVGLVLAIFLGAVLGLLVFAITRDRKIPFGPYLALGGFLSLLYGPQLLDWYLSTLGT